MWAVLSHCCVLPSMWCPLSGNRKLRLNSQQTTALFAQTWSLPQSGACRIWDVQGCNCSFCGGAGRQIYAYLFVWGSGKQLWIILVIPHYYSEFFSPTCSDKKPSHSTSVASPSRGLAALLGNVQVFPHRTSYTSPDKTPKHLGVGLCSSEEGKLKAMLWDSAVHPGHEAPQHVLIALAQAEAPVTATLFKLQPGYPSQQGQI